LFRFPPELERPIIPAEGNTVDKTAALMLFVVSASLWGQATYKPFSIWYHDKEAGEDHAFDWFRGGRANGDMVSINPATPWKTLDFTHSHGITVWLELKRKLMNTSGMGLPTSNGSADHSGDTCEGEGMTGESKTLLGFEVFRYWDKDLIGDTNEEWLAPELGCQSLETTQTQLDRGGPLTTIHVATKASNEPPPDSTFEIPKDFREVPPSELWRGPGTHPKDCSCPSRDQMYFRDKSMREGVLDPRLTDAKYVEQVKRAPRFKDKPRPKTFSIWYHGRAVEPNGKVIEGDSFLGRRANGDTVNTSDSTTKLLNFTLSRGIRIIVNTDKKWTTTYGDGLAAGFLTHDSDGREVVLVNDDPKCAAWGQANSAQATGESKKILGFQAFEYREETEEADNKSVSEIWTAPELNCQSLERTSTTSTKAGRTYSISLATAASTEPPVDTEFEIPEV
jgi:hypothetical protein